MSLFQGKKVHRIWEYSFTSSGALFPRDFGQNFLPALEMATWNQGMISSVAYLTYLERLRNKEVSMSPRVGLAFCNWLTGHTVDSWTWQVLRAQSKYKFTVHTSNQPHIMQNYNIYLLKKKTHISESIQFKTTLFKGQLYHISDQLHFQSSGAFIEIQKFGLLT